jgi:hypothetical protein
MTITIDNNNNWTLEMGKWQSKHDDEPAELDHFSGKFPTGFGCLFVHVSPHVFSKKDGKMDDDNWKK